MHQDLPMRSDANIAPEPWGVAMRRASISGFTLIELMVVVAIIAILAAIAIPSYTEQARKSRRADAVRAIGELQLKLERWRAENPSYANCTSPPTPCGSGTYPSVSTSDFYTIQFSNPAPTATTYTITAAPIATSAQKNDRCGTYTFSYSAGTLTKSASGGANSVCSL